MNLHTSRVPQLYHLQARSIDMSLFRLPAVRTLSCATTGRKIGGTMAFRISRRNGNNDANLPTVYYLGVHPC